MISEAGLEMIVDELIKNTTLKSLDVNSLQIQYSYLAWYS